LRDVWDRKRLLSGWNTKLTWIKSGGASKVYDTPYEIYQKRYGPTILSDPGINADLAFHLTSEIRAQVGGRIPKASTVEVTLTMVVGKSLETRNEARKAYRQRGRMATYHSRRYLLEDISNLTGNIIEKLEIGAQLPSKPAWLVMAQVTIRVDKEEVDLIKKPPYATHKVTD